MKEIDVSKFVNIGNENKTDDIYIKSNCLNKNHCIIKTEQNLFFNKFKDRLGLSQFPK